MCIFFPGQHDDARMCIAIALTAAKMGATVANHVQALDLLKDTGPDGKEKICGAVVKDMLTGGSFVWYCGSFVWYC